MDGSFKIWDVRNLFSPLLSVRVGVEQITSMHWLEELPYAIVYSMGNQISKYYFCFITHAMLQLVITCRIDCV